MKSSTPANLADYLAGCKPNVDRYWLTFTAGMIWSLVGVGLCDLACQWLSQSAWPWNAVAALIGFTGGVLVYKFGFARIARRNVARIADQPDQVCVFAFQAWRSYLLIVIMMVLGSVLRHSRLPILLLAVIYLTVGTGLALASSIYYDHS